MAIGGKISVGVAVEDAEDVARLEQLDAAVCELSGETEIIVIVNSVQPEVTRALLSLADALADTTILFLDKPVDSDLARLISIDNAIGDWVLLAELQDIDLDHWRKLTETAAEGFDVVAAEPHHSGPHGRHWWLRRNFMRFYRMATGLPVLPDPPRTRLYSRAAGLYLIGRKDAEMLLKCVDLGAGFPARQIARSGTPPMAGDRSAMSALGKAYRALKSSLVSPIRLAVILAVVAAALNIIYSVYVVLSYVVKDDIAPGWATLSLQNASMFLIFSLLIALLGEYLISIERALNYRLRYSVTREVRSRRSRRRPVQNITVQSPDKPDPPNGGET